MAEKHDFTCVCQKKALTLQPQSFDNNKKLKDMKRFLVVVMAVLCVMCATAQVKYVFYMIGDGMGPNQVLSAEMYQAELQGKIGR